MRDREILFQNNLEHRINIKEKIREQYIQTLIFLVQELEHKQIPYAIAGGFARDLWISNSFDPLRLDGTIRDIDIAPLIEQADKQSWKLFDDISHEIERQSDIKLDAFFFRQVHKRNGEYYLCDRSVEMRVPNGEKIFNPISIDAKSNPTGLPLKVFSPQTLFHLFCSGMGARLRPKDITAVYGLAHYIKKCTDGTGNILPEESYKVFHDFIDERWRRYRLSSNLAKLRELEDFSSFGKKIRFLRKSNPVTQTLSKALYQICEWIDGAILDHKQDIK